MNFTRIPLSFPTDPAMPVTIKDLDAISDSSKKGTPPRSAVKILERNDAETAKPTTADRLIDDLVRLNADAIKLERQVSRSHIVSDSISSSSSITISRQRLSRDLKRGNVSRNRIPKRLDPVNRINHEESAPRYSTNQKNSKQGSIAPSIEHIIIPKLPEIGRSQLMPVTQRPQSCSEPVSIAYSIQISRKEIRGPIIN